MLLAISWTIATLVAIYTLYSGVYRSGSYLLMRAGCCIISILMPASIWHAQVLLWYMPSIILAAYTSFSLSLPKWQSWTGIAIPAALAALALAGITVGYWHLAALYATYGWALGCLYSAREQLRTTDHQILSVIVVGGLGSLVCGTLWGWDVLVFSNIFAHLAVWAIVRYRPQFVQVVTDVP